MPEWRKDPVVDRWVVIATERSKRPSDFKLAGVERKGEECSLCSGREHDTPPEVMAFRQMDTPSNAPGWWVRVVPNKFPAVRIEARPEIYRQGIYEAMEGLGAHEVVVEAPDHVDNLEDQSERQIEEILWAWRERLLDLRRNSRLKYIQVFKNFGQTAGASLEHAHSQIIAVPMVPADVRMEMEGTRRYQQATGRCVFCDILEQEQQEQQRIIVQGENFVALAPFASRFPFETWIIPRIHQYDFVHLNKEQASELAWVLRAILCKLAVLLQKPPYNIVLHTVPVNEPEAPYYHWRLEILPRLTIIAGFELGTGYYINPTPPELAARCLREVTT